tara:strand:- start:15704 stop:16549 length:846 start_codon:yes stop_codon:yes gene_type:complete
MRIVIGTAQFGLRYGYKKNKVSTFEVNNIFKILKKKNIDFFDTATTYGKSQKILGKTKKKKIISKIQIPKKKIKNHFQWVSSELNNIIKETKEKKIHTILFHNPEKLKFNKNLIKILKYFKKKKFITNIGISVYSPGDIKKILNFWKPDIIQFPLNIFDQRILKNDYISFLKKKKIKLMARSCFLQGLALEDEVFFKDPKAVKLHQNFKKWCKLKKINKLDACLNFVRSINQLDYCIFGFENSKQLKAILRGLKLKKKKMNFDNFSSENLNLIDPRKWKKN